MKHCLNCRKLNQAEAEFCERCGERLEKTEQVESTEKASTNNEESKSLTESEETSEEVNQESVDLFHTTKEEKQEDEFNQEAQEGSASEEAPIAEVTNSGRRTSEKKKSHTYKWLVGILILALVGVFGYQKNKYKPEKQVADFIEVLETNDGVKIAKVLQSEDKKLDINKETVQPLIEYLKEHKASTEKIRNQLVEEGYAKRAPTSHDVIYSKKEGYFGKMSFYVEPLDVIVETNENELAIAIDGKTFEKGAKESSHVKLGPIVPGKHVFKGTVKENQQDISLEKTVDVTEKDVKVDLSCQMLNMTISSNVNNAKIYLDGQKIGTLVDGKGNTGPVLVKQDSIIYLQRKNGKKSDILKVKNYLYGSGEKPEQVEMTANFKMVGQKDFLRSINQFYKKMSQTIMKDDGYNSKAFSEKYFVEGEKNPDSKKINQYIQWCRKDKNLKGMSFTVDDLAFKKETDEVYQLVYEVTHTPSYIEAKEQNSKEEKFKYEGVTLQVNQSDGEIKEFKILNLGNGGQKIEDNGKSN